MVISMISNSVRLGRSGGGMASNKDVMFLALLYDNLSFGRTKKHTFIHTGKANEGNYCPKGPLPGARGAGQALIPDQSQ